MKPALAFTIAFVAFAADLVTMQPKDLAAQLPDHAPAILYVGPNVLYRSKHIPGSVFAGPGNTAQGIELLKAAAAKLPHDREVVLYCGCCPWDRCPNLKPAVEALHGMGFANVKVVYMATGFKADWIDANLPVESGQ
jgi:thiosulfate/3-mercaptopyruvate sulfurtransferase